GMAPMSPTTTSWRDKALFTPGPLTTSRSVKQAMLRDLGSRDTEFIQMVRNVRERLVALGGGSNDYTCVLMQGSGTFGIEAMLSSVIPPDGKLLVMINGAYGKRMLKIAAVHKIPVLDLTVPENQQPDAEALDAALQADPTISHVAVV